MKMNEPIISSSRERRRLRMLKNCTLSDRIECTMSVFGEIVRQLVLMAL